MSSKILHPEAHATHARKGNLRSLKWLIEKQAFYEISTRISTQMGNDSYYSVQISSAL